MSEVKKTSRKGDGKKKTKKTGASVDKPKKSSKKKTTVKADPSLLEPQRSATKELEDLPSAPKEALSFFETVCGELSSKTETFTGRLKEYMEKMNQTKDMQDNIESHKIYNRLHNKLLSETVQCVEETIQRYCKTLACFEEYVFTKINLAKKDGFGKDSGAVINAISGETIADELSKNPEDDYSNLHSIFARSSNLKMEVSPFQRTLETSNKELSDYFADRIKEESHKNYDVYNYGHLDASRLDRVGSARTFRQYVPEPSSTKLHGSSTLERQVLGGIQEKVFDLTVAGDADQHNQAYIQAERFANYASYFEMATLPDVLLKDMDTVFSVTTSKANPETEGQSLTVTVCGFNIESKAKIVEYSLINDRLIQKDSFSECTF